MKKILHYLGTSSMCSLDTVNITHPRGNEKPKKESNSILFDNKYSRTLMALTPLEPLEHVQEAKLGYLFIFFK